MRFVVYGRETCPVCTKALDFLKLKGLEDSAQYVDLDVTDGALEGIKRDGFKTIPAIYYNDGESDAWTVVGGYRQLQEFIKEKGL